MRSALNDGKQGDSKSKFDDDYERSLMSELAIECEVMIKFAMKSGLKLPPVAVQALGILTQCPPSNSNGGTVAEQSFCDSLSILASAHEQLSKLVAPATPRTLLFYSTVRRSGLPLRFLGPIKMVLSIVVIALVCLLAFIFLSIIRVKYPSPGSEDLKGWTYHLQLLAAAGIGGSFSALFEASRYIVNSAFDPRYKGYYWVKIVLGLTAGYILAQLIGTNNAPDSLAPATLALLGGFSGTVVYNILKRMSEGVESMVHGDPQTTIDAQQTAAEAQATEEINKAKMKQAAGLMQLQTLVASNPQLPDISKKIAQMLNDFESGFSGSIPPASSNGKGADSGKQNVAQSASSVNQKGAGISDNADEKSTGSREQPALG